MYGSTASILIRAATGPSRSRRAPAAPFRAPARACAPRRARPARRRSAAAVGRARVGGDEQRDVVMAFAELDLELDAAEEGRRRMEDDPVGARAGVGELADAPVLVGLAGADELVA